MTPDRLLGITDVLVDRPLTATEVRSALCALLTLRPDDVLIFEDSAQRSGHPSTGHRVLCAMTALGVGDFRTLLSPWGDVLLKTLPRVPLVARWCRILRCRCLVDDGAVNPYTFLLVDGEGSPRDVALDPLRVDANEYVIASWGKRD